MALQFLSYDATSSRPSRLTQNGRKNLVDFEIKGMEELTRNLNDLAERAERLDGSHRVSIPELLPPSFLAGCSQFASADDMFQASGFKIESPEDFKAIPESEWDTFIRNNTSFESWQQMLEAAAAVWTKNQLGLG
jgi:hypothetical protein